jgi:phosphonate transport system substrate-binding protein
MKTLISRCATLLSLVSLLICPTLSPQAAAQAPNRGETKSIALGLVSAVNQKEIEGHFRDFVGYVSRRLFAQPNDQGVVVVAATVPDLAKLLGERKVDFFMESPYPTYVINNVHGAATLLLRRWKGGKAEYRSLIATNKVGDTNRLQDLRGKIIAFEDPESTSGYFLPKLFLQRNGFKLAQVSTLSANIPPAEVGYIFAKTQDTLIDWVLKKQVAAGALSDDDYAMLDEKRKADLNVLAQTELLPRHLVSVRKDLAPDLIERLSQILRAMHENDEGQKILRSADNTMKFDLLPGGEEAMRRRLLDTFHRP